MYPYRKPQDTRIHFRIHQNTPKYSILAGYIRIHQNTVFIENTPKSHRKHTQTRVCVACVWQEQHECARASSVPWSSSDSHHSMPTMACGSQRRPHRGRCGWSTRRGLAAKRPGDADHPCRRPSLDFRRRDSPQQAQKATPRRAARAYGI